ncbi:MAG TPA: hypothetical protein VGE50_13425 [Gammaproteobacteria bacterium]
MYRTLKLFHLGGLTLFLGSILTYVLISAQIEGATLEQIAFGRAIISMGTRDLTLPGLWLLIISGIGLGYLREGQQRPYLKLKLLLAALIISNAYLLVVPAATSATVLAEHSVMMGQLSAGYQPAYLRETIFGALNVVLTCVLAVLGVWKMGANTEK